ncbi:hypothetical protein OG968_00785 [Streptomyces althioticus]|uniref:hypothetical protein n=1 Tax=Streptomyces althioticus TaxID=83380 RepID=UPI0038739BC5|nr:hypothetical protein OG968_00785 [Streptomyces althioticus]
MPTEPHDVPVTVETTMVIRNARITIHEGWMERSPQSTIMGIVPLSVQVPIRMPIEMRISSEGMAESIFDRIPSSISSQVTPSASAMTPATAQAATRRTTASRPSHSVPVTMRASISTTGSAATNSPGVRRSREGGATVEGSVMSGTPVLGRGRAGRWGGGRGAGS